MDSLKKIMVVDDEAGIRGLLADVLTSVGFNVTLAKDGQESLDQMQTRHFDLLITDIHMPRIDGIELLKRMKRAGRDEKVIVMSGNPLEQTFDGDDMPHVFTRLHKPFQIPAFLEAVSLALA